MTLLPFRAIRAKLVVGATLLWQWPPQRQDFKAEDITKSFTISGRPNVRVDTNDGSVRVTGGDSKEVQFHVEYQGYQINKDLRVDTRQDGDRVELVARVTGHWGFTWGSHSRNLHIEVVMPKTGDLQVSTGDGAVEAYTVDGNISISTGDGSVKASSLTGTVDLHSGDGSINVDP